MKFAIKITETLTRTVIIDADDYDEAERKVKYAYNKSDLQLHADNSVVTVDYEDDTKEYIDLFGKEEFESMEECNELESLEKQQLLKMINIIPKKETDYGTFIIVKSIEKDISILGKFPNNLLAYQNMESDLLNEIGIDTSDINLKNTQHTFYIRNDSAWLNKLNTDYNWKIVKI